jgi:putative oxidoreductase
VTKAPFLIGRMMFGGYFLYNGINHFLHTKELAQYAGSRHVPKAEAAVRATGATMLIGGTSILLGVKPKFGTAAIIGFLAATLPSIHSFWTDKDPQAREANTSHFAKNLALLGAALALAGVEEPWPVSVAHKPGLAERAKKTAWKVLAA